jgi:hypothetical protein
MQNDPNEALLSKPQTKAGRLQRAVLELLHDHRDRGELPTSNRFLFYELVQRGILDKTKTRQKGRGADQDLSDASKRLRDAGLVPWGWIVDETRSLTSWVFADTVAEYLKNEVDTARVDCWDGEPPPLLICESRTFGGVLNRTLAPEYLCPVTATNGQAGGFLHTNVVPILEGNERRVLYIGDLDHRGALIEANTKRVLVREAGERDWQRVALTTEQSELHGLEPIEKLDRAYRPPRAGWAIEVEALGQGVVTDLVRDALDRLLPEPLEDVQAREQVQRDEWKEKLDA